MSRKFVPAAVPLLLVGSVGVAAEPDRQQIAFFEKKIRPVLVAHCYECHSAKAVAAKELKGELLLDTREGVLKGGESGPAVVPGKPGESLLIGALRYESFEMPPKKKLPDAVIADFVKWVEMGAPDPRDGSAAKVADAGIDLEAGREHWAFQPLRAADPPKVEDARWSRNPIDRFVRKRQLEAGVTPSGRAAAVTLARRLHYDLIGLPPEPERVDRFVAEAEEDFETAYTKLVDELLASERHGERWARHWLDVVRFAESNGYAFDRDRKNAWQYRDFVIRAFNEDLPYDEFVRLQIAGDLLADLDVETTGESKEALQRVAATGFVVAGPFTTQQTQKERERSRYGQLDDMIHTLGTSMLGLTVGCARCHDHEYDPLPSHDYYRLASCFADVGFSETSIVSNPEEYHAALAKFDAAHAPLVAARTEYEQGPLAAGFAKWLQSRPDAPQAAPADVTLEVWQHVGPFPAKDFDTAFAEAFPPEQEVDLKATYREGALEWTARPEWKDGAVHNVLTGDNAANYLYRVVESAEARSLALSLGSDDAIKVWVNGEEVLAKSVGRAAAADQERITVPLQAGRNEVLLKIVNGTGPSGFYFAAKPVKAAEFEGLGPWHHVGPFTAKNFNEAYDKAFPPEARGVDLGASFAEGELTWTARPEWKDGAVHAKALSGKDNAAHYLFREVIVDRPRAVALSLGSDDAIKVWLNGREVLAKKATRNAPAAGQEQVTLQLPEGRSRLLMKIVNRNGESGFYFQASPGTPPKDVQAVLAITPEKWNDGQRRKAFAWYRGFDRRWLELDDAVAAHDKKKPQPKTVSAYAAKTRGSTYNFGADTYKVYHLRRGNAENKESEASPGFLRVLMGEEASSGKWLAPSEAPAKPPRVALADWLTDVDEGAGALLARVIVNRLWQHHFGRGIVATPSDFGTRGEPPTHPEMLDFLAGELVRQGWKLKPIHRLIVTSEAYRQAGDVIESSKKADPDNRLLWRRSPQRLEAEIVRDALLAVAGELDTTAYGPGTLDETSRRRSVYLTVKRSRLIPFLQLFDAPGTMQGVGEREESTVSPQALALLNSPFVRGLAEKFAARVRPDGQTSIEDGLRAAHRVAFARNATTEELGTLRSFVESQTQLRGGDANAERMAFRDACHLLLCANEFLYVD